MRKYLFIFVLCVFLAITHSLPAAADIAILIDGSGSMKGFATSGSISNIVSDLQKSAQANKLSSDIIIFRSNDWKNVTYLKTDNPGDPTVYNGQASLLSQPLQQNKSKYGALVMITDNLDNSTGDISTRNFFAAIQNIKEIKQLSVIPIISEFRGITYPGRKEYNGKLGLIAYLVTYSKDYNRYRDFRESLPYDVLHFYPINAEHLRIGKPSSSRSEYELESRGARYILSRSKKVQLPRALETDKWNPIKFDFDLSSRYKHFYFKKNTKVYIDNVSIKAAGGKIPIKYRYKITPNHLVKDLLPDQSLQSFSGELLVNPSPTLVQELAMMIRQAPVEVYFTIHLKTEKNGLSLLPAIRDKYFSREVVIPGKIYSGDDLLSILNPYNNNIVLSVQNLNDPKHPQSTIYINSKHQYLFLLIGALLLVGLVILVNYLLRLSAVKPIQLIENEKEITLPRFSPHKGEHYTIHNGMRVMLTVTSPGWHLERASRRTAKHVLLPSIMYTLTNDAYTESIVLRYKKL
ncbi:MAG: hypothetical protein PHD87_05460 [Candidatus Cloacimonetes bacterium]|jgi:hypothetical protein|nr:hypothetical protein [Candidatus Cloacimonadota bacterium]